MKESSSNEQVLTLSPPQPLAVHTKISSKSVDVATHSQGRSGPAGQGGVHSLGVADDEGCHETASCSRLSFSDSHTPNLVFAPQGNHDENPPIADIQSERNQEQEWKRKAEVARDEADEKAEVVEALKKKIADLHVRLQGEIREKQREQERCKLMKEDCGELRIDLEWHKRQLHECQVARDRLQKELEEKTHLPAMLTTAEVTANESVDVMPAKDNVSSNMNPTFDSVTAEAVALERLENIQKWAREEKSSWEAMVADLERQVKSWKEEAQLLSEAVAKGEKEVAVWMGRVAEFQQKLEEHAMSLEVSQERERELEERCAKEEASRRAAEGEREEMKVAWEGALREKAVLDGAVECIKKNFDCVLKRFNLMRFALAQKEKKLAEMEAAISVNKDERIESLESIEVQELHSGGQNDVPFLEMDVLNKSSSLGISPAGENYENLEKLTFTECRNSPCANAKERNLDDINKGDLGMDHEVSSCVEKTGTSVELHAENLVFNRNVSIKSRGVKEALVQPTTSSEQSLLRTIPPFESLPKPTKLDEDAIMELLKQGEEYLKKRKSYPRATLKASLESLSEEVSILENQIKLTCVTLQKNREIKAGD